MRQIKFAAVFLILLVIAYSPHQSAWAQGKTILKVCVNNTTGDILSKKKCKSIETRLSESSYSQGSRIINVALNGAAHTTIQSALDAAAGATPTAANPVVIKVAPGTYSLSSEIVLADNVSLQGSGVDLTILSSTATTALSIGENSSLVDLTVASTSAEAGSVIVLVSNITNEAKLNNIKLTYSGASSIVTGVYANASTVRLSGVDVEMTAQSGAVAFGIDTISSATLNGEDIKITIVDGGSYGAYIRGGTTATLSDCEITLSTSTGNDTILGIKVSDTSSLFGQRLKVKATETATGVAEALQVNNATNVLIKDSYFETHGFANAAVYADGTGQLKLHNAVVVTTGSNPTLGTFDTGILSMGGGQLSGNSVIASGGTLTCAGVYNESFTFSASSCP